MVKVAKKPEGKEFFKGEQVLLTERVDCGLLPDKVPSVLIGIIIGIENLPRGTEYLIKVKENEYYGYSAGNLYDRTSWVTEVTSDAPGSFRGDFDIARLNPAELREGFPAALERKLDLIRQLANESDESGRAAILATTGNLTRYLSPEIDAAYKEAERLANESDETGKAATLATLRNLNTYLQWRNRSRQHSA